MKKKMIILILALVVLAALLGAYKVVKDQNPVEDTTPQKLVTAETDDLYKYAFSYDGEMYSFTLSLDEGWYYDADDSFDVNSSAMAALPSNLWETTISRTLEDVDEASLEEYGLKEPLAEIQITLRDETVISYHVGNQNASTKDLYVYVDDDPTTVYLVSSEIASACNKSLDSLADQD